MYYLVLNGTQSGPFDLEYLRSGLKNATLRGDSLYWQEGMTGWEPLDKLRPLLSEPGRAMTADEVRPFPGIGGFWQRLGAFLIDVVFLGLIGFGSGFFLFRFYMSLGVSGLLIGLAIATAYFGILSSRLGGGQTLGMRLLGLRVVDERGALISPARSTTRYFILAFPFFLNKALINGLVTNIWLGAILMVPVIAGFASLAYLLIFNRGTRQLVHDLVTQTYVVRATSPASTAAPTVWRGHVLVVGILCLASFGLACLSPLIARLSIFRETFAIRQAVLDTGEAQAATVTGGTTIVAGSGGVGTVRVLSILVHLKGAPTSSEAFATKFAGVALRTDPVISSYNRVDVSISWGYDIGIASGVVTDQFQHTPDEWKAAGHH